MVVTRSMSRTTKKTDTKVSEFVEDYQQNSNMMVTRAKCGTTKEVDTKNVVKQQKLAERPTKKISTKELRRLDRAFSIFIIETFRKEYWEKHPEALLSTIVYAGQDRWLSMTDMEKAPYVELAKKKEAEELEIYKKMKKGQYV